MTDTIIRTAFHNSVLEKAHVCDDTFVVDELGLKNGQVRADIAVLNGKLIGYEIKTDNDTLMRLPHQIAAYNEVFDKVYIITGNKHLANVLQLIPEWWGVYLIRENNENVYNFRLYRKAKVNKYQQTFGLAQLLWKDEVIEILTENLKASVKKQMTKDVLYSILSLEYTPKKFSKIVLTYLKSRDSWRTSQK